MQAKKIKDLEELVEMLKQQLKDAHIEPILEVVPLVTAKERLQHAISLMISGDPQAEIEFNRWDTYIRTHPEHIAEEKQKLESWTKANDENCVDALRVMKSFVPPDISQISKEELIFRGCSPALARRLFDKKILWWCRLEDTSIIAKIHAADLNFKYAVQGLDLVELQAVWSCVPDEFENDPDGVKMAWRASCLQKLKEFTDKKDLGSINPRDARNVAYKGMAMGIFDPETGEVVNAPPPGEKAQSPRQTPPHGRRHSLATSEDVVGHEHETPRAKPVLDNLTRQKLKGPPKSAENSSKGNLLENLMAKKASGGQQQKAPSGLLDQLKQKKNSSNGGLLEELQKRNNQSEASGNGGRQPQPTSQQDKQNGSANMSVVHSESTTALLAQLEKKKQNRGRRGSM